MNKKTLHHCLLVGYEFSNFKAKITHRTPEDIWDDKPGVEVSVDGFSLTGSSEEVIDKLLHSAISLLAYYDHPDDQNMQMLFIQKAREKYNLK